MFLRKNPLHLPSTIPPDKEKGSLYLKALHKAPTMISIQDLLLPNEDPLAHHERMEEKRTEPVDPAAGKSTHFQIEFILDTICPHCYIGLKNLTAAMQIHQEKYPDDTFEVTFSPVLISRAASRSGRFSHFI